MNIPMQTRYKILGGVTSLWGVLGLYRGNQYYDYKYKQYMNEYNEKMVEYNIDMEKYNTDIKTYPKVSFRKPKQYLEKPYKYYSVSFLYGLYGSFMYLSPFPGIFFVFKEIYILEVNLRNLDDDKKTKYYNSLDF